MSERLFHIYDANDPKDRAELLAMFDNISKTEKPYTNVFQALYEHHERAKARNAEFSKAIMEARRSNLL